MSDHRVCLLRSGPGRALSVVWRARWGGIRGLCEFWPRSQARMEAVEGQGGEGASRVWCLAFAATSTLARPSLEGSIFVVAGELFPSARPLCLDALRLQEAPLPSRYALPGLVPWSRGQGSCWPRAGLASHRCQALRSMSRLVERWGLAWSRAPA